MLLTEKTITGTSNKKFNGHKCAVKECTNEAIDTRVVYLEKISGDQFLFEAPFCRFHLLVFDKSIYILIKLIESGEIVGIDPNILKKK